MVDARTQIGRRPLRSTGFAVLLAILAACVAEYPPPPETARAPVVDVLHGEEIEDPYRWLEQGDSEQTRTWIDLQNRHAEEVLGEPPARQWARRRLRELMDVPSIGSPRSSEGTEVLSLRRAGEELASIVLRETSEGELRDVDPEGRYGLVLDPRQLSADLEKIVDVVSLSPDGRLLLYSVREGGEDETTIRLRDLEANVDLDVLLPRALNDQAFFARDGSGFYYTTRSRTEGSRLLFHRLGTSRQEDTVVFDEGVGSRSFVRADELDGGRLLVSVQHGWDRSELYLVQPDTRSVTPLVADAPARFRTFPAEGRVLVLTNLEAPKNRLLELDLERPDLDDWREIVPESDDVLSDVAVIAGRLYLTYVHEVASRIRIFELDGTPAGEVPVPEHHTAAIRDADEGRALLTLTSFLQPPVIQLVDLESGRREVFREPLVPFTSEGYEVHQVRYTSKDGTSAPMYLVHREGIERSGKAPTLLHGYGGFNVARTPRFDPLAALWIEAGGIYALATLRGGGEYGEEWHRAGMLENKQNVFDDFVSAAEWLIDAGYTAPRQLAIHGTSNGGLLVGAALTQRPELFRAVLCGFPDLDMVRFFTFTETNNMPALLEYGDAEVAEQFAFLRAYSPYQAVEDGVAYPAVMLTSGDRDTRVPPLQARKMTARLQAATASGLPVILRYHPRAGHAADRGLPLSRRIEDVAAELTFLMQQLGVEPPEAEPAG